MTSVAGYSVQPASGEFRSCLPLPGKARFLLVGGGAAWLGKAWASAQCMLSPVLCPWNCGALLPLSSPYTPGLVPLRVCASVEGQAPAWLMCLPVIILPGAAWKIPAVALVDFLSVLVLGQP